MSQATVATPTQRYNELAEKRKLCRTLMGGTKKMIEAGETFMKKHPAESDQAYAVRLKGTTLFNALKQAVHAQTGKVFSSPIIVGEDVPEILKPYLENIDGEGRELTPFATDLFMDCMIDGVTFLLVDFPVVKAETQTQQATLADQLNQGARPYCVPILADNLIGWKTENRGGVLHLTEVRIKECITVEDGQWGEKNVERIRVLRPGSFEVWEQQTVPGTQNIGAFVQVDNGFTKLDFIPLVAIYSNRVGYMEGEPPLQSLAELNLEHWVSSSEQRKALTLLRFAMLVLTGADKDAKITIGPDKVIKLPIGAEASYVEHNGSGLDAGFKDLEQIERRMETASMLIRVQQAGRTTATAAAIDSDNSNAGLLAIAKCLEDALELVLEYMSIMMGLPVGSGGSLKVNDDFGQSSTPGLPADLRADATMGLISQETYLNEMKRRGVYDETLDVEEEIARTQSQIAPAQPTGLGE